MTLRSVNEILVSLGVFPDDISCINCVLQDNQERCVIEVIDFR